MTTIEQKRARLQQLVRLQYLVSCTIEDLEDLKDPAGEFKFSLIAYLLEQKDTALCTVIDYLKAEIEKEEAGL